MKGLVGVACVRERVSGGCGRCVPECERGYGGFVVIEWGLCQMWRESGGCGRFGGREENC